MRNDRLISPVVTFQAWQTPRASTEKAAVEDPNTVVMSQGRLAPIAATGTENLAEGSVLLIWAPRSAESVAVRHTDEVPSKEAAVKKRPSSETATDEIQLEWCEMVPTDASVSAAWIRRSPSHPPVMTRRRDVQHATADAGPSCARTELTGRIPAAVCSKERRVPSSHTATKDDPVFPANATPLTAYAQTVMAVGVTFPASTDHSIIEPSRLQDRAAPPSSLKHTCETDDECDIASAGADTTSLTSSNGAGDHRRTLASEEQLSSRPDEANATPRTAREWPPKRARRHGLSGAHARTAPSSPLLTTRSDAPPASSLLSRATNAHETTGRPPWPARHVTSEAVSTCHTRTVPSAPADTAIVPKSSLISHESTAPVWPRSTHTSSRDPPADRHTFALKSFEAVIM
eukprot:Opistho-2@19109